MKIIKKIKNFAGFGEGHERTNRAKKNIIAGFVIKGLNIGIGLLMLPITINYLNETNYGIWVTLTSVVAWFGFFDIGFGNGLRNRFAEALANGDHKLAKTYVSTTYAILIILISVFLLIFYIINFFLDWNTILNAGNDEKQGVELGYLALVVFTSFGFTFVFNLIGVILNADQKTALSASLDLIGKSLSLIFIFILTRLSEGSLLAFGIIYSVISPIVLITASWWFFKGKYKAFKPSFSTIDFSKAQDLFSIGAKFFIIQISGILLYQTNNMIISHLFGPAEVAPYSVAFKYFSVLMMAFMIVVSPFWSAFTEAWTKQDIDWIKKSMNKLMSGWLLLVIAGSIMISISDDVFRFWIRSDFEVGFWLSFLSMLWVLINAWNGIFSQFLNGVGRIKLQLVIGIIAAITNIPLALFLGNLYGIEGVLISNVILGCLTVVVYPIQYRKLITGKAYGIFNK